MEDRRSRERSQFLVVLESLAGSDRGALEGLSLALEDAPNDPDLWNDLGVAYALQAAREQTISPLFRALEAFESALQNAPDDAQALFNRSLLLGRLGLAEAAVSSWEQYLALESQENWETEARVRLAGMTNATRAGRAGASEVNSADTTSVLQLAASSPTTAFENWQTLAWSLPESTEAWASYCADDQETWAAAGRIVQDKFQDHLLAASGRWLMQECEASSSGPSATTGAALRSLGRGFAAESVSRSRVALAEFRGAEQALAATGSPLVWQARVMQGSALLGLNDYAGAERSFSGPVSAIQRLGFRKLLSRAQWGLGTIALRNGRSEEALEHYEAALSALSGGISPQHSAVLQSLVADTLSALGDYERAWSIGIEALYAIRRLPNRDRLFAICNQLAAVSASADEWSISLRYQTCVVDSVGASQDPAAASDAYVWRALCHYKLGMPAEAIRDLDEARSVAARLQDSDQRQGSEADIDLVQGFALEASDPERAAVYLERAARFYSSIGHDMFWLLASVGKADVLFRVGDAGALERQLDQVDRLYRRAQAQTSSSSFALTLLGTGAAISDRRVRFELEWREQPLAALAASDRARTTEGTATPTVSALRRLAARLPEDVAVLAYAWLDGHLVSFLLRNGSAVETHRVTERLDSQLVGEIAIPDAGGWAGASAALYETLIAPHAEHLLGVTELVIVPDGPLFAVPFPLLRSSRDRYLVQDYAISVVPSLATLLEQRHGAWSSESIRRVAAIVDPATTERNGSLGRLSGARAEAEGIGRSLNATVEVLADEQATPGAFLEALRTFDLVHFGGHGRLVATDPTMSHLLLAPDATHPDGRLTVQELHEADLGRPRLVVLASCGSASSTRGLPFSLSLVRPLLDAGIPLVVGSLRELRDDASEVLMERFYTQLGQGIEPAAALRAAQLEMLELEHDKNSIPNWGFLQLYGYQLPDGKGDAAS